MYEYRVFNSFKRFHALLIWWSIFIAKDGSTNGKLTECATFILVVARWQHYNKDS